jgi:FtsH-binding integral membrane protein
MKYIILIVGLTAIVIMALNIDNKIYSWVGVPLFFTITVVNIVRVFRKPKNK